MKLGIKGTFTLTVRDADGNVKRELKFDNLITNNGMDRIAGNPASGAVSPLDLWNRVVLSTNSTAPAVTDTAMGGTTINSSTSSPVYNNDIASSGSPNYIFTWRAGYKFNTGTATGTWASIGLEFATGSVLFCKTLIRSGGTPTTLTILASESLDIRYDFTVTPVITDSSGTVTINGTVHNWTARTWALGDSFAATALNKSVGFAIYGYTGSIMGGGTIALGSITAGSLGSTNSPPQSGYTAMFLSGGNADPTNRTWTTYTSGSYTRTMTLTWGSTHVASGGVVTVNGATVRMGGICPPYQFIFSPAIPKGPTEELSLTFTVTWVRL
jgi:hypothetical protein